jgi:hypothetical protein
MRITNDLKRTTLSLSRKFISDLAQKLNHELKELPLHFEVVALDRCYEIVEEIKSRLDQLKSDGLRS